MLRMPYAIFGQKENILAIRIVLTNNVSTHWMIMRKVLAEIVERPSCQNYMKISLKVDTQPVRAEWVDTLLGCEKVLQEKIS